MAVFSKQHGFSIIEVIVILVGIAVVGTVGYVAIKNFSSASKPTTASTTSTAQTTSAAPTKIQSKSDVQQTIKSLNNDQSDKDLDPSQLDSELTKLL